MHAYKLEKGIDLISEVFTRLTGSGNDLGSNLVVFPGRRPAHFLRRRIGLSIRQSAIPPQIFSIDEFVDFIYGENARERRLEPIDACAVLYKINTIHFGDMPADDFFALGLRIYNELEELYIENVEPMRVKELADIAPAMTADNILSMYKFYKEFYKVCRENGYSTRAMRYRDAATRFADANLSRFQNIILAGFYGLSRTEEEIFRKLKDIETTTFIFQDGPGIDERLKRLGLDIPYVRSPHTANIRFFKAADTHGEIFALNSIIRDTAPGIETVIVLPDSDTLFPLINHVLNPIGRDLFNISMGYPLDRTPVYSFFNSLCELILSRSGGRFYVRDYLRFVLHPYTKNILYNGKADVTRIMFHKIEAHFAENRAKMFFSLDEIEEDTGLFKDVETVDGLELRRHLSSIHKETVLKFMRFEDTGNFASKAIEVLTYIYENSTSRLHPFFYPFSEAFINSFSKIASSEMAGISFLNEAGYFNLFRKFIQTRHSPFEGTPLHGLQVLGMLETRNITFEKVYILDMNEGVIPQAQKTPLIPLKIKEELGIPTYKDKDGITAYYLDILLQGAKEVSLFYLENPRKEPSRFIERLFWEREKERGAAQTDEALSTVRYKIRLKPITVEPIKKMPSTIDFLKKMAYSPTSLDTYMGCGIRFYYKYTLGIKERVEATGRIEREDIGRIVHTGLQRYFSRRLYVRQRIEENDPKEMTEIMEAIFRETFGEADAAGTVYLLKKQTISHMQQFINKYHAGCITDNNITILAIEKKMSTIFEDFKLTGFVDRIDKRDGRITIIDYKTSSMDMGKRLRIDIDRLNPGDRDTYHGSLQLPFYIHLYHMENPDTPIEEIDALFIMLGSSELDSRIELPLYKDRDKNLSGYHTLMNVIRNILTELTDIKRPFSPAKDKKSACPTCPYRTICGG